MYPKLFRRESYCKQRSKLIIAVPMFLFMKTQSKIKFLLKPCTHVFCYKKLGKAQHSIKIFLIHLKISPCFFTKNFLVCFLFCWMHEVSATRRCLFLGMQLNVWRKERYFGHKTQSCYRYCSRYCSRIKGQE